MAVALVIILIVGLAALQIVWTRRKQSRQQIGPEMTSLNLGSPSTTTPGPGSIANNPSGMSQGQNISPFGVATAPALSPAEQAFAPPQAALVAAEEKPNFILGLLAGTGAAAIGALLWALVTFLTNFQIGFMALGVGFLVGYAVRQLGKGSTIEYGIMGAVLSVLGCLAGNLLAICIAVARVKNIPFADVFLALSLHPSVGANVLVETFTPIQGLFYVIAIYRGFQFSIKPAPVAA